MNRKDEIDELHKRLELLDRSRIDISRELVALTNKLSDNPNPLTVSEVNDVKTDSLPEEDTPIEDIKSVNEGKYHHHQSGTQVTLLPTIGYKPFDSQVYAWLEKGDMRLVLSALLKGIRDNWTNLRNSLSASNLAIQESSTDIEDIQAILASMYKITYTRSLLTFSGRDIDTVVTLNVGFYRLRAQFLLHEVGNPFTFDSVALTVINGNVLLSPTCPLVTDPSPTFTTRSPPTSNTSGSISIDFEIITGGEVTFRLRRLEFNYTWNLNLFEILEKVNF